MKTALLTLPIAIASVNIAIAQENPPEMEETVVVASRVATPINKVLVPVTLITKQDINIEQPPSLASLLDNTAGITLAQNGGKGSTTTLMIRGANTNQSVVLLDGLRIGSATLGTTPFQYIDPYMLDRVEVVRGSRSSLYGADAIGGVVQLITNEGMAKEDYNQALVKQSFGSNNSAGSTLGFKGQQENLFYQFAATHYETTGFDNTDNTANGNDDDDGFRNTTYTSSLGYHFNDDVSLKASYYQSKGKTESDNSMFDDSEVNPYTNYLIEAYSLKANWQVNTVWRTELVLGKSENDNKNADANSDSNGNAMYWYPTKFNTKRYLANWLNEIDISDQQRLISGIDYQDDKIEATDDYSEDKRDNTGYYVQYELSLDRLHFSLSGRYDDNSAYGNQTTGQGDIGFDINDNLSVVASYGTAFRAPSFNDLYWPADPYNAGNPDIKPETSKNTELSLRGHYDSSSFQINWFHNKVEDLIQWGQTVYDDAWNPIEPGIPENLANATLQGIELVGDVSFDQFSVGVVNLGANYTYLDARDDKTNNKLQSRPEHSFNIDLNYQLQQWIFSLNQQIRSSSYSDADEDNRLSGYSLTNLRVSYNITDEWTLSAAVNNLFDKEYFTTADYMDVNYNNDGINSVVSIAYTPSW